MEIFDGVAEALLNLKKNKCLLVIISNQSLIGEVNILVNTGVCNGKYSSNDNGQNVQIIRGTKKRINS